MVLLLLSACPFFIKFANNSSGALLVLIYKNKICTSNMILTESKKKQGTIYNKDICVKLKKFGWYQEFRKVNGQTRYE